MKCKSCNGTGKINVIDFTKPDWKDTEKVCPVCNGTGKIEEDTNPYKKLYTVKVYSNAGYIISYWDNVISTAVNSDRMIYLKLDNDKSVTVVGGIVIVEEK